MRQSSKRVPDSAEKTVRDIRREVDGHASCFISGQQGSPPCVLKLKQASVFPQRNLAAGSCGTWTFAGKLWED